jgi:hypothetical protein
MRPLIPSAAAGRGPLLPLVPRLSALLIALSIALGARSAAAAPCACGQATCPAVTIDEDNRTDLNCAPELVGQSLPDSDSDGIPDACDACACAANPLDPDTGRAGECPAPQPTEPPPVHATPIRCVDGHVVGIPAHATVWLLRPQTLAFTRFEPNSSTIAAGPELLMLRSLGLEQCTTIDVGGKPSIKLIPAPWHWRAGLFASLAFHPGANDFDAAGGLSSGLDYRFPASGWTLGPSLHVLTLLGSTDPTPLLLGLGPRLGAFDFIALTPFVQLDALHDFRPSYGAWVTFDVGALEDLGVEVERLGGMVR